MGAYCSVAVRRIWPYNCNLGLKSGSGLLSCSYACFLARVQIKASDIYSKLFAWTDSQTNLALFLFLFVNTCYNTWYLPVSMAISIWVTGTRSWRSLKVMKRPVFEKVVWVILSGTCRLDGGLLSVSGNYFFGGLLVFFIKSKWYSLPLSCFILFKWYLSVLWGVSSIYLKCFEVMNIFVLIYFCRWSYFEQSKSWHFCCSSWYRPCSVV